MSLTGIADLAVHPTFVRRVTGAAVKAAIAIGAEEYDGTQYRIMRRALATNVLRDASAWGKVIAWPVAGNGSLDDDSSDSDIEWTVSSVWDAVAGAYTETAAQSTASTTADES